MKFGVFQLWKYIVIFTLQKRLSTKNEWEYRTVIDGDGQKQFSGNEKWSKSELYVEPYFEIITFLIDFDLIW